MDLRAGRRHRGDDRRLPAHPLPRLLQRAVVGDRPAAGRGAGGGARARRGRRRGRRLRWWVDERTRPGDTEEQLHALGLRMVERLEVLALPVDTELPVPDDVTRRPGHRPGGSRAGLPDPVGGVRDVAADRGARRRPAPVGDPAGGRAAGALLRRVRRRRAGRRRGAARSTATRCGSGTARCCRRTGGGVPTAPSSPAGSSTPGRRPPTSRSSRPSTTPRPRSSKRLGFTPYGEQRCWSVPVAVR